MGTFSERSDKARGEILTPELVEELMPLCEEVAQPKKFSGVILVLSDYYEDGGGDTFWFSLEETDTLKKIVRKEKPKFNMALVSYGGTHGRFANKGGAYLYITAGR